MFNPTLNLHDQILQRTCPTIMVPRFEDLPPLTENGHRFLVAQDGLWLEVKRPWLHLVWPVAEKCYQVAMPYGALQPAITFEFDSLPRDLIDSFIDDARRALPNEYAAWIIWNSETGKFSYCPLAANSAGPAHLKLDRPVLGEHEHLVVDIHSHANMNAFFSGEDNRDDAGEVKLSIVVGRLGSNQQISSKIRLCANGVIIPAQILAQSGMSFGIAS